MKNEIKKAIDKLKLPCCQAGGKIYVELPKEGAPEAQQSVIEAVGDRGATRRWSEVGRDYVIITPNKAAKKPAPEPEPEPATVQEEEPPA